MYAYFDTHHVAAVLFTTTIGAWGMMELGQRSGERREGATRIREGGGRLALLVCLIAGAVMANFAPLVVPAAAIRPGVVAFAAGMVVLLAGLVLRGWSFKVLGRYFTHTVMVSSDQPVIATGPYRVLRHPSYAAVILAGIGAGLASANWADLAVVTLLIAAPLLWRIHIEESALMTTLGDRYRVYAAQHKRLVPLVW
jgi:protein-S-isoprenylcysteine O-methyltransferase Ste14